MTLTELLKYYNEFMRRRERGDADEAALYREEMERRLEIYDDNVKKAEIGKTDRAEAEKHLKEMTEMQKELKEENTRLQKVTSANDEYVEKIKQNNSKKSKQYDK